MSIPSDSAWRGTAALYPQPLNQSEELGVQHLLEHTYYMNCGPLGNPRLDDIVYRSSEDDQGIRRRVFRWDLTPYQQVIAHGFQARREENIPETTDFNLHHYVHNAGRPLESTRAATHAFVSTTLNRAWHPSPSLQPAQSMRVYHYEINAPGGIWVSQTLGHLYEYPAQDEVSFIGGIAPQYIRSAQLYLINVKLDQFKSIANFRWICYQSAKSVTKWVHLLPCHSQSPFRYTRCVRVDDTLILNANFNPQSDPPRLLSLRGPVVEYVDKTTGHDVRERRPVYSDEAYDWYTNGVDDIQSYINAGLRARNANEAYLFMKNEYVLVDYPGSTGDRIIKGVKKIIDCWPSLRPMLPRNSHGLDEHDHHGKPQDDRDHDEL
ncbi:uncharacterized protein LOC129314086 [Prosopis cineraria]|uniref:uncharacterized protein LOC129314086 n=1 Tax=Prosopis cineraria TaxID=364024 RepID=UPI00240EEB66|nr:uncharacterized protein LOC129314086 [Prosopis cineraria]